MTTYRRLAKGEIIQDGDEIDRCANPWHDEPRWVPVHPGSIGDSAPDPQYVAHRQYRRPVCDRCEGDGKAHGSDRPFEWHGPETYPGPCPVCNGTGKPQVNAEVTP